MASNPWDYYERLGDRRGAEPVDAVSAAVADVRAQRAKQTIMQAPESPVDAARVTRVAREAGEPPALVEARLTDYEKAFAAQRFADVAARYSVLGEWFGKNPRAAVAAQNDHKSLGILGGVIEFLRANDPVMAFAKAVDRFDRTDPGSMTDHAGVPIMAGVAALMGDPTAKATLPVAVRNSPAALKSGAYGQGAGLFGYLRGAAEDEGWSGLADWSRATAGALNARSKAAMPRTGDWVTDQILGGVSNVPSTATTLGVGMAGRAAGLSTKAAALVGSSTGGIIAGGQSYNEARDQGVDATTAFLYANTDAVTELAGEYLGTRKFLQLSDAGANVLARFLKSQVPEVAGELFSETAQSFSAWAVLPENKNKTLGDWAASLPERYAATVVQTLVAGGISNVTISAFEKGLNTYGEKRRAAELNRLGDKFEKARSSFAAKWEQYRQAKANAEVLTGFEKAAADSAMRANDPDGYAEMVGNMAEQSGVTGVMVDAAAVREYMQSDSYDPYSDPLEAYRDQVDEAFEVGGDVVLPSDFALGTLPGTSAWSALKDDMRLTAGGMTPREAQTFEEAMADVVAEVEASQQQEFEDQQAQIDAQGKLLKSVQDKLMNAGFTPYAAQQNATLIVQRIATRAARMGQQVQGNEFTTEVRQVLPPELAAARDADATDLVINALRKGKDPTQQSGPSLLEWISARGGVNDSGGDLASMGLDQWHKGKPGKRKLVRKFDPTASLGGITGAGDYGVDTTLRAAIEAGYFPELANVANEAGVDTLDTQVLLDAMSAELASVKRYAADARVDAYRAAAEELDQLLMERGLDPAGMSDAELRAAIAGLDRAGSIEGRQYDQSGDNAAVTLRTLASEGNREAIIAQALVDSSGFSVEQLANILEGVANITEAQSLESVEAFAPMLSLMRRIVLEDDKVLDTIVGLVPVDVVNDLGGSELAAKELLHDQAMLKDGSAFDAELAIPSSGDGRAAIRLFVREVARMAAKGADLATVATGRASKASGATDAYKLSQDMFSTPKARITFGADLSTIRIELFESRNLSSLLHELGHQYLEELRFDSESPNAPEQLVKDMETAKAWFAANGHPVVDGVIPTEAHELWARGFERYLMEGKAPSSALARVFETFRGWLMSIYKKVDALRSPITPEIREVFDRLLATDEEIQQQREAHALMPLFKDAAAIGMTGPEFQAYQEQFTEARVDAQSEVLAKAMREVKARVTKEYRDQRAVVEADVTESVDQRPLFRALRNLKTMPVRRGWLEDNMGLDVFDLMPKRVPPLWSDKGAHPDAVAEMSGYGSGRQMIEALIGAEMAHRQAVEGGDKRTLRERTIQSEVDAIMRERYGDPLTDGTIEREALAAVNGEKQGEVLASELRILSRKTGQRPTPYRIARQWARNKVRQGVYATEASPSAIQRHARAVAKHGSEAEKAMLAGKFDEAFAAKQKQMLSSALLAEAKAANDEVTAAQRYLDKIARAKTMKSVDQDYLDQAQALLEDVDLRQRSQKSLDRKESFERWAAAKQAAGEEVYVPDRFDYAGTNWSRLPVEQLLGLADTVKSIMHLGRHKQTMLDNKDRREFDEWKADALAVLELTPGRAITNEVTEQRSNTRAAMALGLKVETLALELDNGVPGVWTALLSTRPTTAENERAANREKVLAPIAEAFRKMDRKDRDRLADRVTLPEMPFRSADLGDPRNGTPLSVSRMELIGMALNMGNESNFDKLARGYGVDQSVIEGVVNRELTEKDWQFVQSVWDALETLWPDIAATEREMSGVEPERVEVREVVTPFGTLRGGYYPLVYDPSQSQVGEDNLAKASDDMFGLSSGVATAKGHTKARTGFAAPLLLSPEQVIFGHVEKVITRNAYAPLVRDILKVMRDPTIRAAFDRKMGREYREMIEPWLRRQVRAGVTDERGVHWANKLLRQARINVTLVSMGLRFSTGVAQIAGISNSIGRIGVNQFRKGFARVLSNPRAAAEFVFERSPEMERRNMELNRDVAEAFNDLRNTSQGRKGIMAGARTSAAKARAFAFWHIGMIDRYVVSMPTWLGAYEQAISDGKSDEEASALADSAVRQSQGSGREKDMAAIQSPDSEALKFFTMFYTPFNVLLNAQWETARGARRGDWRKVAQLTFWFMIAAPLVDALLSGDAPDDDDDETWAAWLARNVLTYQVAGIPIIRDIGNYAERKIRGEYVTFGSNPVTRIFDTTARTGKDAWNATLGEGEVSDRWVRNAVETPGYFLGLPTGQVSATSQFMWDYSNGDVDPETIGEWYEGLTKGKIEEEG